MRKTKSSNVLKVIDQKCSRRGFFCFLFLAFLKSKNAGVSARSFKDNNKDTKQMSMVVTLMPFLLTLKKNLLFRKIICSLKQMKLQQVTDQIVPTKLS